MDAKILQDFRVAQLAVKGAYFIKHKGNTNIVLLEGIDVIPLSDCVNIACILLDNDIVTIDFGGNLTNVEIDNFSDMVIVELTNKLREVALELTDRDVRVNGKGEIVY